MFNALVDKRVARSLPSVPFLVRSVLARDGFHSDEHGGRTRGFPLFGAAAAAALSLKVTEAHADDEVTPSATLPSAQPVQALAVIPVAAAASAASAGK